MASGNINKSELHAGHRNRMRSRFIENGGSGFKAHELIELLLFSSIPRRNVNEDAHILVNTFGSLSALLNAHPEDIIEKCKYNGLTVNKNSAILITLIRELTKRYMLLNKKNSPLVSSSESAITYGSELINNSDFYYEQTLFNNIENIDCLYKFEQSELNAHKKIMRERFFYTNGYNFSNDELLELLLFYTIKKPIDVNLVAKKLLFRFASIDLLLQTSVITISKMANLNLDTAINISLVREIHLHCIQNDLDENPDISNTSLLAKFCSTSLAYKNKECFLLICVNSNNKVVHRTILTEGSTTSVNIDVSSILNIAHLYGATGIIIAHNHPGGYAIPSVDDINITTKINNMAKTLNLNFLDHIIVADDNNTFSFLQNNLVL